MDEWRGEENRPTSSKNVINSTRRFFERRDSVVEKRLLFFYMILTNVKNFRHDLTADTYTSMLCGGFRIAMGKKNRISSEKKPFCRLCLEILLTVFISNTSRERMSSGAVATLLLCSYYYVSTRLTIKRGFDGVQAFRGGCNKKKSSRVSWWCRTIQNSNKKNFFFLLKTIRKSEINSHYISVRRRVPLALSSGSIFRTGSGGRPTAVDMFKNRYYLPWSWSVHLSVAGHNDR